MSFSYVIEEERVLYNWRKAVSFTRFDPRIYESFLEGLLLVVVELCILQKLGVKIFISLDLAYFNLKRILKTVIFNFLYFF